ncbi:MAG: apolipoprotein N-acyltransferase [Candidatus Cardinium sp.]|uniref:apolipoprotein N-acyltransferase n=1 Tax=Cardinium endosymbiont of Dermatophagoides farinae TaxID=2597823 RepID=UPI0011845345|nr:apolipoprotein N-acyltransferase [Cardinium endosymbiont of Dermatophagoides farinae]TSJ80591.1 apolipoprotein N-acyltransferase [Cardinium endosymbiont of Dermatophagoides farinae]UWW96579.1 MAG: apolipoprotein N-acyltransferase [Candidatus Cardinium sp.]
MPHYLVSDQSNSYVLWLDRIRLKLFPKQFFKAYVLLLVALSSSLFYLSWCSCWFGFLLCIAIVPMLAIMKLLTTTPEKKIFCWTAILLTLLLWNTLTVWWIYKAAFEGFLFAACYNTVCLALPWFFYYYIRKWSGLYLGYLGLVTSWLTLEHAHLSWTYWELTFPWLNLGNGLAALPQWIQWYEYTGILGGSLWILITNILLYHLLFEKASFALLKGFLATLLLPITTSFMIYYAYQEKGMDVEAVVVQPNFDSYTEKNSTDPSFVPYSDQINRLLTLSKEQLTPATALVVWPESAIDGCWLEEKWTHAYLLMQPIFQFLERYASLHLITGVSSICIYGPNKATQTAERIDGSYIDTFNSVFYLKAGGKTAIYHKVKRLPGGEYIPYFHLLSDKALSWLKQRFLDIGGIIPTLGKGDGAKVFEIDAHIKVAPIICYELLYGAFVGSSVQQGANLLAVTTNDGWWGNTPIYHQFFQYSRLIAIAHRRSVMRAANTGISGFIDQRGAVIAATNRLEAAAMRATVRANNQMTFYSLYGDYIGHIASWACLLLFCIMRMMRWRQKKRKPILATA